MSITELLTGREFYVHYAPYLGALTAWVFVLGACIGSFLNVVIWRLPRGESIVTVPSHCPKCNKSIRWYENIPIFSWLFLRGRCSKCSEPISPRYIVIETLTAFLFVAVFIRAWKIWELTDGRSYWPLIMVISYLILTSALVAISVIDIDLRIVPDRITFVCMGIALVMAMIWPHTHELGGAVGSISDLRHKMVLSMVMAPIARQFPVVLQSPRVLAVLDGILGILLGGGLLWAVAEVGKRLRGSKSIAIKEAGLVEVKRKGYQTPKDNFQLWDDTFIRSSDELVVYGSIESVSLRSKAKSKAPDLAEMKDLEEFVLSENGIQLGDTVLPLDDIKSVTIRSREWIIPLEPMGMGDATLMAMVGAFLGPGAIIFILTIGSFIGAFLGILKILFERGRMYSALPFGPSLAAATMCYILLYYEIVRAWFALMRVFGVAPGM